MKRTVWTLPLAIFIGSGILAGPAVFADPAGYPPLTHEHLESLKDIARDLKNKKDFLNIRRLMDLAIAFDPNDWELYKYRGRALKVEGRYAESIADFKKLLSLKDYDFAHLSIVETYLFWKTDDQGRENPTLHLQRVQQALAWIREHEEKIDFPDVVTLFRLFDLIGKIFSGEVAETDFINFRDWLTGHPLGPRGRKWGFDDTVRRIKESAIDEAHKKRLIQMVRLAQAE